MATIPDYVQGHATLDGQNHAKQTWPEGAPCLLRSPFVGMVPSRRRSDPQHPWTSFLFHCGCLGSRESQQGTKTAAHSWVCFLWLPSQGFPPCCKPLPSWILLHGCPCAPACVIPWACGLGQVLPGAAGRPPSGFRCCHGDIITFPFAMEEAGLLAYQSLDSRVPWASFKPFLRLWRLHESMSISE